jgi:hypothetical protein
MRIRKGDQAAFDEAVGTALLAVVTQVEVLRDVLDRAIDGLLASDCPTG